MKVTIQRSVNVEGKPYASFAILFHSENERDLGHGLGSMEGASINNGSNLSTIVNFVLDMCARRDFQLTVKQ